MVPYAARSKPDSGISGWTRSLSVRAHPIGTASDIRLKRHEYRAYVIRPISATPPAAHRFPRVGRCHGITGQRVVWVAVGKGGLRRTAEKGGERSFAHPTVNGEDAPKPAVRGTARFDPLMAQGERSMRI